MDVPSDCDSVLSLNLFDGEALQSSVAEFNKLRTELSQPLLPPVEPASPEQPQRADTPANQESTKSILDSGKTLFSILGSVDSAIDEVGDGASGFLFPSSASLSPPIVRAIWGISSAAAGVLSQPLPAPSFDVYVCDVKIDFRQSLRFLSRTHYAVGTMVVIALDYGGHVGEVAQSRQVLPGATFALDVPPFVRSISDRTFPHKLHVAGTVVREATHDEASVIAALVPFNSSALKYAMAQPAGRASIELKDAFWRSDLQQLSFYYASDKRVNFSRLVHKLHRKFRTRIWMTRVTPEGTCDDWGEVAAAPSEGPRAPFLPSGSLSGLSLSGACRPPPLHALMPTAPLCSPVTTFDGIESLTAAPALPAHLSNSFPRLGDPPQGLIPEDQVAILLHQFTQSISHCEPTRATEERPPPGEAFGCTGQPFVGMSPVGSPTSVSDPTVAHQVGVGGQVPLDAIGRLLQVAHGLPSQQVGSQLASSLPTGRQRQQVARQRQQQVQQFSSHSQQHQYQHHQHQHHQQHQQHQHQHQHQQHQHQHQHQQHQQTHQHAFVQHHQQHHQQHQFPQHQHYQSHQQHPSRQQRPPSQRFLSQQHKDPFQGHATQHSDIMSSMPDGLGGQHHQLFPPQFPLQREDERPQPPVPADNGYANQLQLLRDLAALLSHGQSGL